MHPSPAFAWTDEAEMLAFVVANAWARVFTATPAGLRVAHVPVVVTAQGALRFHLAKANAMTPHLGGARALVVVEGPSAYVSGNWYTPELGAAPTWNYVAVELEGAVAALDRDATAANVGDLARILEPRVSENWTPARLESRRFQAMLNAIAGFELAVAETRGTRKLSQNKPVGEIARVLERLEANDDAATAAAMRQVRASDRLRGRT
jgi:transcriptional regulator